MIREMPNKVNEKGLSIYTSRPWELGKTIFLILTWIVLGVHLELVSPTLTILGYHTNVTITGISTILVTRNAGYMFGNIVGALIEKIVKKHPEGLLFLSFLVASLAVFITPMITNIIILSTVFFFQGISQGITDLSGTNLMLSMWTNNVAAPLNIVHLGYGFGAVFANLVVKQYLSDEKFVSNSTTIIEIDNIQTPYTITSCLCLIISVGYLIYAIKEKRRQKQFLQNRPIDYSIVSTIKNIDEKKAIELRNVSQYSPRLCGNGSFNYGLSMSIVWILYMFFVSGNDQTFGKFFFEFLRTPKFAITKKGATWGMIIYWLSYSVGRLICAIITVFLPVHYALSGLWICGLILAIVWYIFVWIINLTSTSLFVLGAFTGLIFSPTFPLSFAFINQRLNVNPLLVGLLLCGSALGGMCFQKLGGIVLDKNRKHFPTLLIICVIIAILCFIIAIIISSIHQKKLQTKKTSIEISDNNQQLKKSEDEQQIERYLTDEQ